MIPNESQRMALSEDLSLEPLTGGEVYPLEWNFAGSPLQFQLPEKRPGALPCPRYIFDDEDEGEDDDDMNDEDDFDDMEDDFDDDFDDDDFDDDDDDDFDEEDDDYDYEEDVDYDDFDE